MSDLHEARGPEREPQIDTVGWLFCSLLSLSQPPLRWLLTKPTRWLRMPLSRS
jgi:hypothetical protein